MKTKIKRHSRSVISVILAVCMLVSCMTVGMIATDAAKVQSESVGNHSWYNGNYNIKGNFTNWQEKACAQGTDSDKHYYDIYEPGSSSDWNVAYYFRDSDNSQDIKAGSGNAQVSTTGIAIYEGGTENIYFNRKDLNTVTTTWKQIRLWIDHNQDNPWTWIEVVDTKSALTPTITTQKSGVSTDTFTVDDTVSLSTSTTNNFGTVNYSYKVKQGDGEYSNVTGTTYSPSSAGTYTFQVTATDTAVAQNTNSNATRTATAEKTITVLPAESTQTVTAVASPASGTGTVSPASAPAGESAVMAEFTAAPELGYDVKWTLGGNLKFADSTSATDAAIKVNLNHHEVDDPAANTATATFTHQDVELHLGTKDDAWELTDVVADFTRLEDGTFEFDTNSLAKNTGYKHLTANTDYYLYVTTKGAQQASGVYYKGPNTTEHPTVTTSLAATVTRLNNKGNFGGRNSSVHFKPGSTEAYTFTFNPLTLQIGVRASVDPTKQGIYSLSGNVTDKYIVDSTVVKPNGIATDAWWATYHPELSVTESTGTNGVYKISFTTTNYNSIHVGLAGLDGLQYSFIDKDGKTYDEDGNDYSVTGNVGADTLYVYPSKTGGSLTLQPNTTYTITIDQNKYYNNDTTNPRGMVTIDCTTVYANAVSMVQNFDINQRRYSDPVKSTAGGSATATVGGTTAATASGTKPIAPSFTAGSPAAGYTFAGWYIDPECTELKTENTSFSESNVNVTHTYYALYRQNKPADNTQHTITLNITGGSYGSVVPVSGAEVETQNTLKVYNGATAVFSATPNESTSAIYSLSAASATGSCSFSNDNGTLTLENITGDVTLNVTFTEKTAYTVTLKATNGSMTAQALDAAGADSGDSVDVASGATKTISVPVGGKLKLTKGTADANSTFSYFNVESGKYKRTSDQSTGTSPFTFRPTDDLTAEAVYVKSATSGDIYFDFTDTTPNAYFTKRTDISVPKLDIAVGQDVYVANFTLANGNHDFIVKYNNNEYKFSENPERCDNDNVHTAYYNTENKNNYARYVVSGSVTYTVYLKDAGNNQLKFWSTTGNQGSSYTPSTNGYHLIFAMDGTLGSTAGFGDTVITSSVGGLLESEIEDASGNAVPYAKSEANHNVYYFNPNEDAIFTVQTTVTNTNLGVRGFVYNGKAVTATEVSEGVYAADITVKAHSVVDINGRDDVKNGENYPILEIIPVYYNTLLEDNDYIKFYVDANTMDNKFGYNIGYYAWFADNSKHEIDENYPGQPLLKEGTKYYTYVPKFYLANDAAARVTTGSAFAGVLLNNLHENNSVHDSALESWGCAKENYQTFDYEDPAVISALEEGGKKIDTIEFVAKFQETNRNHQTGTHWYGAYNKTNRLENEDTNYGIGSSFPATVVAPTAWNKLNGFELLRNFDNKPVDIYGNVIQKNSADIAESDLPTYFDTSLFVVSVGNQSVGEANDWDTVWMVYSYDSTLKKYTLAAKSNPAEFIQAATQDGNLKGKTVYVNYEKFLDGVDHDQANTNKGTGNTGDRIDGRWLYSFSSDATVGHIRVATVGKNGDTLNFLTYNEGGQYARIAYRDDTVNGYEQNGVTTKEDNYGRKTTFPNRTTEAKAVLQQPNGYKIVGFYQQKMGVFGEAEDNYFSTSWAEYDELPRDSATVANYTNSRDTWIVAILEPVPKSNLHITHEMYGGEGAHNGAGYFYFKADVLNSSGVVVASTNKFVDGNDGYDFEYLNSKMRKGGNYTIRITLRTVMAGTNTLYQWYSKKLEDGSYEEIDTTAAFGKSGTQEKTIVVNADTLYGENADSFQYTNLDYYSDIDMGGSLHITHQKFDGSDGDGEYWIKVVKTVDGSDTTIVDWTKDKVTIPSSQTKRNADHPGTLSIYVKTDPDEYSTFVETYDNPAGTNAVSSVASEYCVKTININNELYTNEGTEENPEYTFNTAAADYDYYTKLNKQPYKYSIIYDFTGYRELYGPLSYVVQEQYFTNAEIAEYFENGQVNDADHPGQKVDAIVFKRLGTDPDNDPGADKRKAFINLKAPYENDFMYAVRWQTDWRDSSHEEGMSYTYTANTKTFTFIVKLKKGDARYNYITLKLPYAHSTWSDGFAATGTTWVEPQEEGHRSDDQSYDIYRTGYGMNYTANGKVVTAPASIIKDGNTLYFSYWSVKNVANDKNASVEYTRCYSREFNLAVYQDSILEPVYKNDTPVSPSQEAGKVGTDKATITFVENSRTNWTEGRSGNTLPSNYQNGGDRIYTDFLVSFAYKDLELRKDSTGKTYKAGIVIETVDDLTTGENGQCQTLTQAQYADAYNTGDKGIDKTKVKTFIEKNKAADGDFLRTQFDITYQEFDNTTQQYVEKYNLDNRNRADRYYSLPNVTQSVPHTPTERKNKLYRAYSYLVDSEGKVLKGRDGSLMISDPIYFTIYDIASIENMSAGASYGGVS